MIVPCNTYILALFHQQSHRGVFFIFLIALYRCDYRGVKGTGRLAEWHEECPLWYSCCARPGERSSWILEFYRPTHTDHPIDNTLTGTPNTMAMHTSTKYIGYIDVLLFCGHGYCKETK